MPFQDQIRGGRKRGTVLSFVSTESIPINTNTITVTGVPFRPKLVIFYPGVNGTLVFGSEIQMGAADGVNQWVVWQGGQDNVATTNTWRSQSTTSCVQKFFFGSGTVDYDYSFGNFTDDGFVLNANSPNNSSIFQLNYICFGGEGLTDVSVGSFAPGIGIGQNDINVGFRPTTMLFSTSSIVSGNGNFLLGSHGMLGTKGDQVCVNQINSDNVATSNNERGMYNTSLIRVPATGGGTSGELSFNSWLSNGVRLDRTTGWTTGNEMVNYIAMRGPFSRIIEWNTGGVIGQQLLNYGFNCGTILNYGGNNTALNFSQSGVFYTLGAATSKANSFGIHNTSQDNVSPSNEMRGVITGFISERYNFAGALVNQIEIDEFLQTQVSLNKSIADGANRNQFTMGISSYSCI